MEEKKEVKKELTDEEKLALIRKYERKIKTGSDIDMLREKSRNNSKNSSINICDKHWDGA